MSSESAEGEGSPRSPLMTRALRRFLTQFRRLTLRHKWCLVLVAALTVAAIVMVGSTLLQEGSRTYARVDTEHARFAFYLPEGSPAYELLVSEGEGGAVTIVIDVWDESHEIVVESGHRECQAISYRLGDVILEALHASCELSEQQLGYWNGHTGYFHSLADAADPHDVEHISTRLGKADLFTISYSEATNTTYQAELPVAIITLTAPLDPNYPTLTVRTDRYNPDRELIRSILESIDEEHAE